MPATFASFDLHKVVILLLTSVLIPASVHLPATNAIIDVHETAISLFTSGEFIPASVHMPAIHVTIDIQHAALSPRTSVCIPARFLKPVANAIFEAHPAPLPVHMSVLIPASANLLVTNAVINCESVIPPRIRTHSFRRRAAAKCDIIKIHNPRRFMCDYAQNLVLMRYAHKSAAAAHTAVTYSDSTSMATGAEA